MSGGLAQAIRACNPSPRRTQRRSRDAQPVGGWLAAPWLVAAELLEGVGAELDAAAEVDVEGLVVAVAAGEPVDGVAEGPRVTDCGLVKLYPVPA